MEIVCPGHGGVIYVPGNDFISMDGTIKNLVVECPVCDEEVLINDVYGLNEDGRFYQAGKD